MLLSSDEQTRISRIQPTISDIVQRYTTQWVLDGNIDAAWDAYVGELRAAGLDEITGTFQQAYDRFFKAKN
ncbi:MAG: hypothetical protein LBG07_08910 [Treponema sp.]|jgi:putative aldouronate transport system substrate-binding protein|nr:hypothetical protein [Treponema sp.]